MDATVKMKLARVLVLGLLCGAVAATGSVAAVVEADEPFGTITGLGGKCLDVFMGGSADGTPVVLYQCNDGANQLWQFESVGYDVYLRSSNGKCLRPGSVGSTGFVETELGLCGSLGTFWQIGIISPSTFGLRNVATDQCLDVFNNDTSDGTPIIVFDCQGSLNQQWTFNEDGQGPATCMSMAGQMCLNEGRFAVEANWVKPSGESGIGRVVSAGTDDSGLFYFFNPVNWEMLVKVLDNCDGPTNRFWVFAAASTTVQYTLKVTDTETGQVREYFNPQGNRAAATADTDAFATCP